MSDEYIRRQDAVMQLSHNKSRGDDEWELAVASDMDIIRKLPSADVAPVVHAYWIPQKENYEFKEAWMKCSACGYPVSKWTGNTNFCPNCGAKMDGKE